MTRNASTLFIHKVNKRFYKVSGFNVDLVCRTYDNQWSAWAWEPFLSRQIGHGQDTWHAQQKPYQGRWHCIGVYKSAWEATTEAIEPLTRFIEILSQSLSPQDLQVAGYRSLSESAHER